MSECWIVEKPSAGIAMADALFGGIKRRAGPIMETNKGPDLVVTVGHAITLANPEEYDPAFKSFDRFDVASLLTQGRKMVPSADQKTRQRRTDVGQMVARIRKASSVVIATDAGREGEMIAWELLEEAGYRGPVKRLWTSSTSPESFRKAYASLLPGDDKKPLYWAGLARSIADYSEGYSFSRIFTKRNTVYDPDQRQPPISVGRVQTAIIAVIDDRCRAIEDFVPLVYYEVTATVSTAAGELTLVHRPPADKRVTDLAEAEAIARAAQGCRTKLSVRTQRKRRAPPNFCTTSSLQKKCYSAFGLTPEHTLDALQALYDPHHTTYPRTECIYLSDEHPAMMQPMLDRLARLPGIRDVAALHPAWFANAMIRREFYDSSKLTDHHAITPDTNYPAGPQSMPTHRNLTKDNLWSVYDLVARHTVAQLLPDMQYDSTTVSATAGGRLFTATGQVTVDPGWTVLFPDKANDDTESKKARRKKAPKEETDDEADAVNLPPVKDGEDATFVKTAATQKKTTPPPYFTMGSIVDMMVNIDLYVEDEAAKEILIGDNAKQKKGIGTGATRGAIIKKIFSREYVYLDRKALKTTPRGRSLVSLVRKLVPWMADPIHTATQEGILLDIEGRKADHEAFISRTLSNTSSTIAKLVAINDRTIIESSRPPAALTASPARRPASARPAAARQGGARPAAPARPAAKPTASPAARAAPAAQSGKVAGATYYQVKYDDKDEARAMGMRWDPGCKMWYAPDQATAGKASVRFRTA